MARRREHSAEERLASEFRRYLDEYGRAWSPLIERGSDGTPVSAGLPTREELRDFRPSRPEDVARAFDLTQRFGLLDTPDKITEAAMASLQRFDIAPGDPRWERELERLVADQGRVVLGEARRVSQRYDTLLQVGGDTSVKVIYVNEGDNPCEECAALNGWTGTYAEALAENVVPGARCLGRDLCQCDLMAIE